MTPKPWAAPDWASSPALGSRGKEDPDLSGCPTVQGEKGGRGASFFHQSPGDPHDSYLPSSRLTGLTDALLNS